MKEKKRERRESLGMVSTERLRGFRTMWKRCVAVSVVRRFELLAVFEVLLV